MCGSRKYPYTHPKDGHWKFQRGWGWDIKGQNFLKEGMKLNWNSQRDGGMAYGFLLEQHNELSTLSVNCIIILTDIVPYGMCIFTCLVEKLTDFCHCLMLLSSDLQ